MDTALHQTIEKLVLPSSSGLRPRERKVKRPHLPKMAKERTRQNELKEADVSSNLFTIALTALVSTTTASRLSIKYFVNT